MVRQPPRPTRSDTLLPYTTACRSGGGPTASAVVADLIDVARGEYGPAFGMPVDSLDRLPKGDAGKRTGRVYLRFKVKDRPGVLAEIAAATRDAGVSIESMIQRGESSNGGVLVVIVTHAGALACVTEDRKGTRGADRLPEDPRGGHNEV